MIPWLLSALSCLGFVAILLLSLCVPAMGKGAYWPPPSAGSWQHNSFRALFRLGLYPLVALSALVARSEGLNMTWLAVPLIVIGLGGALWITAKLGWKQAFGEAEGLVTAGAYAWSRNPVYVATWIALVGWAIALPHPAVVFPLALWALLYWVAPFLEEPWLEVQFGEAFREYKSRTPRFFFGS